eukprot:1354185-Prorocentrum_lima.AAC.1
MKETEAIIETNESEGGSKVGTAVSALEIGLSDEDWCDSLELEAFLRVPYEVKMLIEHNLSLTGASKL